MEGVNLGTGSIQQNDLLTHLQDNQKQTQKMTLMLWVREKFLHISSEDQQLRWQLRFELNPVSGALKSTMQLILGLSVATAGVNTRLLDSWIVPSSFVLLQISELS